MSDPTDRAADRAANRASIAFLICAAAAAALAIVYWTSDDTQLEGLFLGIAMGALAFGFITGANRLLPQDPVEEEREVLVTAPEEKQAFAADFERVGQVGRRRVLLGSFFAALAALGAAALFPIRSLGPRPRDNLLRTAWADRRRLVSESGRPVRAEEVAVDAALTVFPEGRVGSADGQVILVRVDERLLRLSEERMAMAPGGLVAYSKVCSHAGCPVGLYSSENHQLLCPCHQSAFDVLDGASPTEGPAAWPLPQLPITIDGDGFLRSTGDFTEPVGPGYWESGQ